MSKKAKCPQGSIAMQAKGKRPSQLWYTPEQYALVKKAAAIVQRPMTQFAIMAAIAEAEYLIHKNRGAK